MKEFTLLILSLLILAVFFCASYFVFSDRIQTQDTQALLLIGTAYGAVTSQAASIVSFWFGTSKTSADKDKTISDMQQSKTNPQP